jgi:hypothetical protein
MTTLWLWLWDVLPQSTLALIMAVGGLLTWPTVRSIQWVDARRRRQQPPQ